MQVSMLVRAASAGAMCLGSLAHAQTWTPLAFGPLGGLSGGQYFTSVTDISRDGTTFVGVTNTSQQVWRTPTQDYTLTGGGIFALTPSGTTAVGGASGQNPKRFDISNAVGSTIAATTLTWPGGPVAYGAAYGTNADVSAFAVVAPRTAVITPTGGYRTAQSVFQAVNIAGSAGAYRGMAADAPIMVVLGSLPGNPTNGYRWNYQTDALSPLNLPAGGSTMTVSTLPGSVSADGGRVVGYANLSTSLPYWWDETGMPHPVEMLPGTVLGGLQTINDPGTLAGGNMAYTLGVGNHAILTDLATGEVIDLHNAYSQAGFLPTGWILRSTHHISADGSRIFCAAQAPDGTTRMVVLEGAYLPTPGTLAALAGGFVAMSRRRR